MINDIDSTLYQRECMIFLDAFDSNGIPNISPWFVLMGWDGMRWGEMIVRDKIPFVYAYYDKTTWYSGLRFDVSFRFDVLRS